MGRQGSALRVMLGTTEQGTLLGRDAMWPCAVDVWGLASSDLFGVVTSMVLDLGRKMPLPERQAEALAPLGSPAYSGTKCEADGEQSLCRGLAKDAEKMGGNPHNFGFW